MFVKQMPWFSVWISDNDYVKNTMSFNQLHGICSCNTQVHNLAVTYSRNSCAFSLYRRMCQCIRKSGDMHAHSF